jgi:cobalt-precorrin-5B (C1)-methyltransferase
MINSQPRAGYTLPVFACAAAVAALRWLKHGSQSISAVSVDLIDPAETVEIPIEEVAGLKAGTALAITRSDPGDNLDLTRNTPVWALVEWLPQQQRGGEEEERIAIFGGEGIGRHGAGGTPAIYAYAQDLLRANLERELDTGEKIAVTIIMPHGRMLATRTSNEAFGIVEGLSLLGTTGISEPLSAPGQLDAYCEDVRKKAGQFDCLVFCIGENGLDLAQKMGVHPEQLVKTANWLGPMLVEAGILHVKSILLFGYHGKLLKLAGGIFHTHHHLADARLEILTAHCASQGVPMPVLQRIFACPTADDALNLLRELDEATGSTWVSQVYGAIAQKIDLRSRDYIHTHTGTSVTVGSVLFDRRRKIIVTSDAVAGLLPEVRSPAASPLF